MKCFKHNGELTRFGQAVEVWLCILALCFYLVIMMCCITLLEYAGLPQLPATLFVMVPTLGGPISYGIYSCIRHCQLFPDDKACRSVLQRLRDCSPSFCQCCTEKDLNALDFSVCPPTARASSSDLTLSSSLMDEHSSQPVILQQFDQNKKRIIKEWGISPTDIESGVPNLSPSSKFIIG